MSGTLPLPASLQSRAAERVSAKTLAIPWYIWCNVLAVASSVVGGVWDISWHESVGRDTFWTPAHLLIQLCGILSGFGCGYLILSTTLRKAAPLRREYGRTVDKVTGLGKFSLSQRRQRSGQTLAADAAHPVAPA